MKSMVGTVTLLLFAAAFLLVGWLGLTDPELVLDPVGIALTNRAALNEARAMYGGMNVAMGLVFLAGVFVASVRGIALMVALVVVSGLLVGRGVSIALDGLPTEAMSWVIVSVELLGLMLVVGALLKRRKVSRELARPVPAPTAEPTAPAA